MSGFAEKLNVQNSINSTKNSVHYTYGVFGFEEKLIAKAAQIQWEIAYIISTKYFGFAKKLNIQNCINSIENCVHYICTKRLDM